MNHNRELPPPLRYYKDMDDPTTMYNFHHICVQEWLQTDAFKHKIDKMLQSTASKAWDPLHRVIIKIQGIVRHTKYVRAQWYNDYLLIARHAHRKQI